MTGHVGIAQRCIQTRCQEKLFTEMVVRHWNRLPSEMDDALCLTVFKRKRHLDNAFSDIF